MVFQTAEGAREQTWETNSLTYVLVSTNIFIDIAGREFIELLIVAEDDDGNIDGAEDGQLMGLFEQAGFALEESAVEVSLRRFQRVWTWICTDEEFDGACYLHRAVPVVLYGLDLDLPSTHFGRWCSEGSDHAG